METTYDENGIRTDAPSWFKRLYSEWVELKGREDRLVEFFHSGAASRVSVSQYMLLKEQLKVMGKYAGILFLRIQIANAEDSLSKNGEPMLKEVKQDGK